jgi:hypothetical protein
MVTKTNKRSYSSKERRKRKRKLTWKTGICGVE